MNNQDENKQENESRQTEIKEYLRRLKFDPAIGGGVIVTTVTDVVGFFTFLGVASLVYA